MKPSKHQRSKHVMKSLHNLLFCAHTLCMNYVTNMFVLVSKQLLCFLHGQCQKSEQKPKTKKFVGFHNHSPLLTMIRSRNKCHYSHTHSLTASSFLSHITVDVDILVFSRVEFSSNISETSSETLGKLKTRYFANDGTAA